MPQATPIDHGARINRAIFELNRAIHERYGDAIRVDASALDRLVQAQTERVSEFRRNLKGVPMQDVLRREEAASREMGRAAA